MLPPPETLRLPKIFGGRQITLPLTQNGSEVPPMAQIAVRNVAAGLTRSADEICDRPEIPRDSLVVSFPRFSLFQFLLRMHVV
ncbi:hypothetical protein SAMN05216315_12345 [Nitrosospira sp. Nsp18]|nr:hypothetical protein SAMN05216315_12345 [Nitrosospira sp. Nsp18]